MFIIIALFTLAFVIYLTIRDRTRTPRFSVRSIQKTLKVVSRHILLENWQEAQALLKPIIASRYRGKEASLLHLQVLRGTGQYEKALTTAIQSARRYPEELLFRMEEGLILLEMGQSKEALDAFKVCAPIMRGEKPSIHLATALKQTGYISEAFELLEPWIEQTQSGALIALVGDICFERKQFQQAIPFYLRAFELGHQTHLVTVQLGHAFRRLGNLSEAEKIFRRLLEKDSSDVIATLGLGACTRERGHDLKALLIYQASGAWQSGDARLLKEAGWCALRTGKNEQAERYLSRVLQYEKSDPLIYSHYALALENQHKWQEAEQVYLQLTLLFPSYPHGYRALAWMFGVGLTQTLSQEQGVSFAHVALNLNSDPVSWEILSACEARTGNFERAYQIQMSLATHDDSKEKRILRQQALRNLRKQHPLDGHQVTRSLVA
ncbi:MAG: Beta-barrel assembly-enhancing protease [Chlamydiales bacterium]|nr:Beta-barrel assembly-enhancing protease [Chlamydiales bacterium]